MDSRCEDANCPCCERAERAEASAKNLANWNVEASLRAERAEAEWKYWMELALGNREEARRDG